MTKKPEVRVTPNGTKVASFSVASNRVWKDANGQKQEEAEFHNVVAFGRTAENIERYFDRGDEIYIQGRLKTSSWEAKEGGKRYKTDIIAERFDFGQKARANASQERTESHHSEGTVESGIEYPTEEINPEDIPF
jgi:single-strand DNA-binding protein